MKTLSTYFLFIFISLSNLFAQKEANIWYFGNRAGVDFNSGVPIAITDGQMTAEEGVATISDSSGKLLFYTNSVNVWNKNHQIMPNGTGLKGDITTSSTQGAIIIPKPESPDIYYIFTLDAWGNFRNGLCYSVVDMSLNGGLGDVTVEKNVQLLNPVTEKITACRHANNKDFWVITNAWDSYKFYAYLITNKGLNTTPIISDCNLGINKLDNGNTIGQLKVSPDGTMLAGAIMWSSNFFICDFDKSSGIVSNPIFIQSNILEKIYGLEFSPDGTKIYTSNTDVTPGNIYQFTIKPRNVNDILLSSKYIGDGGTYWVGALQLGPDSKIYVAYRSDQFLGVINQPNDIGTACDYQRYGVSLSGRSSLYGLPNFIQSYFYNGPVAGSNSPFCEGDTLFLTCNSIPDVTYGWTGPNGFRSGEQNPFIPNANASHSGLYTVTVTYRNGLKQTSSVNVEIFNLVAAFEGSAVFDTVCVGSSKVITITFKNSSSAEIIIDSAYIKGGSGIFNLETFPKVPGKIDAQERVFLTITFTPDNFGEFSDSLIIITSYPCSKRFAAHIRGRATDNAIVWLPDTTAKVGERDFCIPLKIRKNCSSGSTTNLTLIAELHHNGKLFYVDRITNGKIMYNSMDNGTQVLLIQIDNVTLNSSGEYLLTELCGTVLLGEGDSTILKISALTWSDTTFVVEKKNGVLHIIQTVCQPTLSRVRMISSSAYIFAPNPANDEINLIIDGKEKGLINVDIYNLYGNKIESYRWNLKDADSNEYNLKIDLKNYSSGCYFAVINAPSGSSRSSFVVVK